MQMEYKIVDNFLSKEDFRNIKTRMVESSQFPWYYSNVIAEEDDGINYQFVHPFYDFWNWVGDDVWVIKPLLDKIDPKAWIRIKANLTTKSSEIKEQGWHIDYNFPCTTAIFYVNDNDGYTVFEDGTRVESKANRFVEFDSHYAHSGTSHTDEKTRVLINMNYIKEGGR
jgi:hypothetical protein